MLPLGREGASEAGAREKIVVICMPRHSDPDGETIQHMATYLGKAQLEGVEARGNL